MHVETALRRHQGARAMVGEEVDRLLDGEPGLRPVVEPAQRRALEALEGFEGTLRDLLEGPHRSPRIGPDLYARLLALELSSSMAPGEVLARAEHRIEELDEQLEEVARQYLGGQGGDRASAVRDALDRLALDRPDDSTIVGTAEAAVARCTDAVRELGVVSVPDQPLRVELMPVFRRGAGGAYCDPPGPLEEGGSTSFAIEPTPEDWSAEQKASFYREYNNAAVLNLTVHEAMPGHMVQLAHARSFKGSTIARRVITSGTFVEGWAVHAERIMAESGFGGLALALQRLKMQLRVAINAVLDVSVHTGDLGEDAAVALMMTRGYQEESEARGKWRRACLTAAQLSTYFVGYSELADLFSSLGRDIDYDEVLAHGSPPPRMLGAVLRH
jgi:uncharacterized protein (DUF885 family)